MAFFRSYTAFDDTAVNFNAPFLDLPVTVTPGGNVASHFQIGTEFIALGVLAFRITGAAANYGSMMTLTGASGLGETAYGNGFTFDADGMIKTGSVQRMVFDEGGSASWGLAGFSVGGAAYRTALTSAGTADDHALFSGIFAGNDRISLSNGSDHFDAGAGRDMILGNGGNDTLLAGDDNDLVDAGYGNDVVDGGLGNDLLFGNRGNDSLTGGVANDTLEAGAGRDTLTGGSGRDCFIFSTLPPNEIVRVTDFQRGLDKIGIRGGDADGNALTFADMTVTHRAAGVELSYTDAVNNWTSKMLLLGVDAVTAADFTPDLQHDLSVSYGAFLNNWYYFD